jgi:hypothetical protein
MREVFIEKNDNKVFCDVIELGGVKYNFLEFIKMPIPDALQKIKQLQQLNQEEFDSNTYATSTFDIYHSHRTILNALEYYMNIREKYKEEIENNKISRNYFLKVLDKVSIDLTDNVIKYYTYEKILNDFTSALYSETKKYDIKAFISNSRLWFNDIEYVYDILTNTFTSIRVNSIEPNEVISGIRFCNMLEEYINSLGYVLGIFGSYRDRDNSKDYESYLIKRFNKRVFTSDVYNVRTLAVVAAYFEAVNLNAKSYHNPYAKNKKDLN